MSNLQVIARRCPVMSKALAVQSARMAGAKRFTSVAAGVPIMSSKHLRPTQSKRALHGTGGNGANLSPDFYKNTDRRAYFSADRLNICIERERDDC
jgi:5-aminolevulinate synthase